MNDHSSDPLNMPGVLCTVMLTNKSAWTWPQDTFEDVNVLTSYSFICTIIYPVCWEDRQATLLLTLAHSVCSPAATYGPVSVINDNSCCSCCMTLCSPVLLSNVRFTEIQTHTIGWSWILESCLLTLLAEEQHFKSRLIHICFKCLLPSATSFYASSYAKPVYYQFPTHLHPIFLFLVLSFSHVLSHFNSSSWKSKTLWFEAKDLESPLTLLSLMQTPQTG